MTTVELAIKGIKASVKFREPHSKAGVREIVLTGEVLASKVEDNPVPSCIVQKVQRLAHRGVGWVLLHSKCETSFPNLTMMKI